MVPSIPAAGNHEYSKIVRGEAKGLSQYWKPQFALPENGPGQLKENVYYTDYQGMRIIALDTNLRGNDLDMQMQWLDEVLTNNPNTWTSITFHHPIFSYTPGRNTKKSVIKCFQLSRNIRLTSYYKVMTTVMHVDLLQIKHMVKM